MMRTCSGCASRDWYTGAMTTSRARSPRFTRPETRPTIQLTDDDVALFWHLYRHRVLDSRLIYALFPTRSEEKLSKRLRRLWAAEYLERVDRDNLRLRQRNGSDHFVYALAREGGKALLAQGDLDFDPYRLKQKNRELHPLSIQHMLQTARFMVELEVSARAHGNARVIHFDEIGRANPKAKRRRTGLPYTLRSEVEWKGVQSEQGTAPDQIFAIEIDGERQYIFLEIDQGTETIEPGGRRQQGETFWHNTSILRKFLIYAHAFRTQAHKEQFGLPVFRVLTVTTSRERSEAMRELYPKYLARRQQLAPPGLLLFTDWQTVSEHNGSLLDLGLTNAVGKQISFDQRR